MSKLVIENISAGYGSVQVLHGVNLEVDSGETVVLLGGGPLLSPSDHYQRPGRVSGWWGSRLAGL